MARSGAARRVDTTDRHPIVGIGTQVGKVGAALQLSDSRQLPAVGKSAKDLIPMEHLAEVNGICNIEQLPAVSRHDPVVIVQIKGSKLTDGPLAGFPGCTIPSDF